MRFKLDENVPVQLKRLFTESGHDAETVVDEGMRGAPDREVAAACLAEERVLLTQDLDFSDIRTYPARRVLRDSRIPAVRRIAGCAPGCGRRAD